MQASKESIQQLQAFNKYAKFIAEHFGISVVFDGTKAQTDGKVIHLPSISSMTPKEIDFLYGILLHEVGHIRYSTFTTEDFAKVKTQAHFHMANAIEDARIEKLLLKDFDGAKDIFYNLYNVHTQDPELMNKVFGVSLDHCSEWHGIGVYAHARILNLKGSLPLNQIIPQKVASKVEEFVTVNNIDQLIDSNPLNSWDDVVKLSFDIYSLYFAVKNDTTEEIDIKEKEELIEEGKDSVLGGIQARAEKLSNDLKQIQDKINDNKQKLQQKKSETFNKISELQKKMGKLQQKHSEIQETSSNLKRKQKAERREAVQEKKITDQKARLEANTKKLEELNLKKPLDETKLPKFQEKVEKLKNSLKRHEDTIKSVSDKLLETKKEIQETKENLSKLPPQYQQLPDDERMKEQIATSQEIVEIRKQIRDLESPDALELENKHLQEQMKSIKQKAVKQTIEDLIGLQAELDEAGLPAQLIPEFQENDGWSEADAVQKEFDKDASLESGKLVTNGIGMDISNVRDMMMIVEKGNNELSQINLADHFRAENSMSKLESFNEVLSEVTYSDKNDTAVFSSIRPHVPLTTQFDAVKKETAPKNSKSIDLMKAKHKDLIQNLKNVFRTKMKFSKKDHFKGNQEEGNLDPRNMWKLATNLDEAYYEINRPKLVNKVSAAIAIDVSGSMDKEESENGKKLQELSLFFSEALTDSHIRHEILGFHAPVNQEMRDMEKVGSFNRASNNLETIVYKQFTDKTNKSISNIALKCSDNADGENLRVIGKRLLKENSKKKVLFVLTDGKPFLSDSDVAVLDQDLKLTLNWLKQNKVEVFAFGFNDQPKEFYGERYCKVTNYQDVIDFCSKNLSGVK